MNSRYRGVFWIVGIALINGLILWPYTFINADEVIYVAEARVLLEGRLQGTDGDPIPGVGFLGFRFPLGWPVLLSTVKWLGFRAFFAIPFFFHLLGTISFAQILARREIPTEFAIFYLVHPVIWSFSRTLMSDTAAAGLLVFAINHWEKGGKHKWISALGLAWLLFMRVASIIVIAGFAISIFVQSVENKLKNQSKKLNSAFLNSI
ncbi:MAG: hypothetical protein RMJ84_06115, partial [Sandaracinaceae bacterium]|nr:hypothetical protein [Sandaracinaceae bacterium]